MALSTATLANLLSRVGDGQNKQSIVFGSGAFTTTGTTVDVTVPLKCINFMIVCPVGAAAAANGQLTINETFPKRSTVGAQDMTVTRAAGTDSGLAFHWLAIGVE
jgi:hypothetical protein